MISTLAEQIAAFLQRARIGRVYCAEHPFAAQLRDAVLALAGPDWIDIRRDSSAALAATADAQLTGRPSVCIGGAEPLGLLGGLLCGLYAPSPVIVIHLCGSDELSPTALAEMYCRATCSQHLVINPAFVDEVLGNALDFAAARRSPSVVVFPQARSTSLQPTADVCPPPAMTADGSELPALADALNHSRQILILCGPECAGAHAQVITLANKVKAPIAYVAAGKEHIDFDNPYVVGMLGCIGFATGQRALEECELLLVVGAEPSCWDQAVLSPEAVLAFIDVVHRPHTNSPDAAIRLTGNVKQIVAELVTLVCEKQDRYYLDTATSRYREFGVQRPAHTAPDAVRAADLVRALSDFASDDAVFACEGVLPTAWFARRLRMNGRRRIAGFPPTLGSASIGAKALGAQAALPGRQILCLSTVEDLPMLVGDLISLAGRRSSVKIFLLNRSHAEPDVAARTPGHGDVDVEATARAIGFGSMVIRDPVGIDDDVMSALLWDGPLLVEVFCQDPDLSAWPHGLSAISFDDTNGFLVSGSEQSIP